MSGADVRSVLVDHGEGHELRTKGDVFNVVVDSATGLLRGHGRLCEGALDAGVDDTAGESREDLVRVGRNSEGHVGHQGQEGQEEKKRCIHGGLGGLDGASRCLLFCLVVEVSV